MCSPPDAAIPLRGTALKTMHKSIISKAVTALVVVELILSIIYLTRELLR